MKITRTSQYIAFGVGFLTMLTLSAAIAATPSFRKAVVPVNDYELGLGVFDPAPHVDPLDFSGSFAPGTWALTNTNANGSVNTAGAPASIALTGGNNGSNNPGTTDYSHAVGPGALSFNWSYSANDDPGFDSAGYIFNGTYVVLSDGTGATSGTVNLVVGSTQFFAFRVATLDNTTAGSGGATLTVSNFTAVVPEPSAVLLFVPALAILWLFRRRMRSGAVGGALAVLAVLAVSTGGAFAEPGKQVKNTAQVTSLLGAPTVVDVMALAKTPAPAGDVTEGSELNAPHEPLPPPLVPRGPKRFTRPPVSAVTPLTPVVPLAAPNFVGFTGISHLDQRLTDNSNQFSIEPPDQALAVGFSRVVEAVNLGFNVYNLNGVALLPRPLSLNEFFNLGHAINRAAGNVQGPSLTDPVAFYDAPTARFFLCVGAQSVVNNVKVQQSQIYLAVSQTSDPAGLWYIYTIDTTNANAADGLGPRFADYEHMAADANGVYFSANEYHINSNGSLGNFVSAAIYCLRKSSLVAGGNAPPVTRIQVPYSCDLNTGVCMDPDNSAFEFTIYPAITQPGASYFSGGGGAQFFVSSDSDNDTGTFMAVWALTNTASLNTASPSLTLMKAKIDTQDYNYRTIAGQTQKEGFRPLGLSITNPGPPNAGNPDSYPNPPAAIPKINSGDDRVQNATYAAGRIWATLSSEVLDGNSNLHIGAAYFCFSPTIRSGVFSATLLTNGTVVVNDTNLLRSAIVSNASNKGAMVFTLQGLNDYPSSAFCTIDDLTVSAPYLARAGNMPEDGFTGYPSIGGGAGIARWGDYSAACTNADGSIFMATMYTPDINRTINANWNTYVTHYFP